jgi:L,D-transpeptidase catalytic domain/Putative peptidoglycan binding domain/Bacterial Ig domain
MRARWWITLGAGLSIAAAAGGYSAYAYATRTTFGAVGPAPGTLVADATPAISLATDPGGLSDLRVEIDGRNVTDRVRTEAGRIVLDGLELDDGTHTVAVSATTGGLFGGALAETWSFSSDTTAPDLTVLTPTRRWTTSALVTGRSEPGATVRVSWEGGEATQVVPDDGLFRVDAGVQPGLHPLDVAAVDAAGNTTSETRPIRFDDIAPVLTEPAWPTTVKDTDSPLLVAVASDNVRLRVTATLNGQAVKPKLTATGFSIETHGLPQGRHVVDVIASDRAGNRTTLSHSFVIDSTEKLTPNLTLMPGARGKDVLSLTRRLRLEGAWKRKKLSIRYDNKVAAAVRRFQKAAGLPQDGIARPALLKATQSKLVIEQSKFRVRAYEDGKLIAEFPVAVGTAQYPTPVGTYVITEKLKNPTWIPPNSPWAKGLEPIPPGAGNPLGTRWIGTSAPAIGLHGTPQAWTIGSRASHGCVRMHIKDVEKLFELVEVGQPVVFKA